MRKRMFFLQLMLTLLFSCTQEQKDNFEDLQQIKVGMKLNEETKKMGNKPLKVEVASWNDSLFIYSFASPPVASDYYKVIFETKDSTVVDIKYGD